MSEKICGFANDEEADAKAVVPFGMQASERIEQTRYLCVRDTEAGIEHVDPDGRSEVTATEKDPPPAIGIFDGVAHEVAENNPEEERIAENGCSRPHDTNANVFSGSGFPAVMTRLP